MDAKQAIADRINNRLDKWDDNDPVKVLARNDPEELEQKVNRHKIKTVAYLGLAAVSGAMIGETDGVAHAGAIAGTVVGVWSAWGNAIKFGMYKAGPSDEQLNNIESVHGPNYGEKLHTDEPQRKPQ